MEAGTEPEGRSARLSRPAATVGALWAAAVVVLYLAVRELGLRIL